MAASPRVVQKDVLVAWDGGTTFVSKGTIVDIPPGSALETAYGGSGNLTPISGTAQTTGADPGESEPEGDAGGGSDVG